MLKAAVKHTITLGCSLRQTQLLVKRVGVWLSAQELFERFHLVLTPATLEHGMAIPASLGGVHRILLEDGVEHVGGVDLGTTRVSRFQDFVRCYGRGYYGKKMVKVRLLFNNKLTKRNGNNAP